MQSKRYHHHSTPGSTYTQINYFINVTDKNNNINIVNPPTAPEARPKKRKKYKEHELTNAILKKNYDKYLQAENVLSSNKLSFENYELASKLTLLLSKLFVKHEEKLKFIGTRPKNISYALHEFEKNSLILFDMSGNKNEDFKRMINRFIDSIEKNANDPHVQEFFQLLKEKNLSAQMVTSISGVNRRIVNIKAKACNEKTTYFEGAKIQQQTNQAVKISIISFSLRVCRVGKKHIVQDLMPVPSCGYCLDDKHNKGYYRTQNSKVVNVEGKETVVCDNPEALGQPGNLTERRLSKSRTRMFRQTRRMLANTTAIQTQVVQNETVVEGPKEIKKLVTPMKCYAAIGVLTQSLSTLLGKAKGNGKEKAEENTNAQENIAANQGAKKTTVTNQTREDQIHNQFVGKKLIQVSSVLRKLC